jgi:hypothetical protein
VHARRGKAGPHFKSAFEHPSCGVLGVCCLLSLPLGKCVACTGKERALPLQVRVLSLAPIAGRAMPDNGKGDCSPAPKGGVTGWRTRRRAYGTGRLT